MRESIFRKEEGRANRGRNSGVSSEGLCLGFSLDTKG